MANHGHAALRLVGVFFESWRFPVFTLAALSGYVVLLAGMLFAPQGDGALAVFAEEFRTWCFGYDPATGQLELGFLLTTFLAPVILGSLLVGVWVAPLRAVWRHKRAALLPWAGAGLLLSGLSAATLGALGAEPETGELPFPAESLRTEFAAPAFELTNQNGETVSLDDLRGRVVLLTAVYSRCGATCPMIMAQTRASIDTLGEAERADISVVGITLDPAHDTPEVLAALADTRSMLAPLYNLVTGPANEVEPVLDSLGFSRSRDPETGIIDHANLFLLVDRAGRIAYRFTLGERQQNWLVTGMRVLLAESIE